MATDRNAQPGDERLSQDPGRARRDHARLEDHPREAVLHHGLAVEEGLVRGLRRLLGADLPIAVTAVRVPTFSGTGASIAVEVAEELSAPELRELLAKSPGVALPDDGMPSPTIREAAESEMVLVGRIRRDPTSERGLLFWLAADPVRLAASNAVRLAETRFQVG